jgi:glycosyltransferase involved in cell wall biosynthesis
VFREEARRFLNDFPEYKHVDRVDDVIDASIVLPVGIDTAGLDPTRAKPKDPPLIIWNQRWEHDKGPEELKVIIEGLVASGVVFEFAMCGEVFVSVPPAYAEITDLLGDRLVHSGWAERDRYIELLNQASVVLSTAHQEFFGIAITEAVAAGAHPVFPNRLVYPERIDDFGADPEASLYESPDEAVRLVTAALALDTSAAVSDAARLLSWGTIAPDYDETLSSLITR